VIRAWGNEGNHLIFLSYFLFRRKDSSFGQQFTKFLDGYAGLFEH